MSMLPTMIYRLNAIPMQIPVIFFPTEIKKKILKFKWNHKGPQIIKAILRKKTKAEYITLLISKHYKAI